MKIESECIYEHKDHGEVLVCDIFTRYKSYDTAENVGMKICTYVRYTGDWDGYGAMPGATTEAPIDEFATAVKRRIRNFDRFVTDG